MHDHLKEKLQTLPDAPGVYLMKNESDTVIYVGKAKVLKNRVRSYFTGSHDLKTQALVAQITDFEYIVAASEVDALLLEANFIKKHSPAYNIKLKDDKSYPYILITKEEHPRIMISRTPGRKAGRYYGPYPNVSAAREASQILGRLLPLRKCNNIPTKSCLYHHIGQCLAPCIQPVAPEAYRELLARAAQFLRGEQKEIMSGLKKRMQDAAEAMRFEEAAECRDLIAELKQLREKQNSLLGEHVNVDIVAYAASEALLSIQIFFCRRGSLSSRKSELLPYYEPPAEAFASYLLQYYEEKSLIPESICVPAPINSALAELLPLSTPRRGKLKELLQLAQTNAQTTLTEKAQWELQKNKQRESCLSELAGILGLTSASVIEIFDISGISGTTVVAGMVQFVQAQPNRSAYRKFNLSEKNSALGDAACMEEVVKRRLERLLTENRPLPNLIIVDGGKAQINAARQAVTASLAPHLPVAGLVKGDKHETRALMNSEGEEVEVSRELFRFLTQMQDEVHRFAITYHRQKRSQKMTLSELDSIPGIGPKRRQRLLLFFDSLEGIKNASPEELSQAGLPAPLAQAVHNHFSAKPSDRS
jgi:excinuclease ABC subunit C